MCWILVHSPSSHMGAWGLPALSPVNKVPGELPIDYAFVLEVIGHRDWHLTLPWQRRGQELTLSPELREEQRSGLRSEYDVSPQRPGGMVHVFIGFFILFCFPQLDVGPHRSKTF